MTETVSAVKSQFSLRNQALAIDHVINRCIYIGRSGDKGVTGSFDDRTKTYHMAIDMSQLKNGKLGVHCSCLNYLQYTSCEHVLALIQATDIELGTQLARSELTLVPCQPAIAIGFPIRLSTHTSSAMHWIEGLAQLKPNSRPQLHRSEKPRINNLLYVLDVADLSENKFFRIDLFLEFPLEVGSKRKSKSNSVLQPVEFSRTMLDSVGSADDKRILTLLSVDQSLSSDQSRAGGYGRLDDDDDDFDDYDDGFHDSQDLLTISPALAVETLSTLCDTGRFFWTLDTRDRASLRKIAWDDTAWEVFLQVEPATSQTDAYVVEARLRGKKVGEKGETTELRTLSEVVGVCESGAILFQDSIGVLATSDAELLRIWLQAGHLTVVADEIEQFLERIVNIVRADQLSLPAPFSTAATPGEPKCQVLLRPHRYNRDRLFLEIEFHYGGRIVSRDQNVNALWDSDTKSFVLRNIEQEDDLIKQVYDSTHVAQVSIREGYCVERVRLMSFVQELAAKGIEVLAEGKLQRGTGSYSLSIASGEDWFDLETKMDFNGTSVSFPTLLAAVRAGQKFVRLDDGSEGMLPEEWLKRFRGIAELGKEEDGKLRFRPSQALMLDAWLDNQQVKRDVNFSTWIRKLNDFNGIKAQQEPVTFQGELREYQREGLGWFKFLEEFRFGGCLADDMGLGKTVQVLALLERRRTQLLALRQDPKPSLAIVPKSLIYNWIAEAAKFSPQLKVIDYTGAQRKRALADIDSANLIVTTYATLRNDIETLKDIEFDYAILDEAQAIKNPNCQSNKAVRLIQSTYRLAMTGTPIENHLGDLWSILNFLNPGMLGSLKPTHFSRTAEDDGAAERLETLSRALRPFILRRTKAQVLTELPEKSEQILYCDMTPKQKKQYQELRNYYALNLQTKVAEMGLNRAKIHVLEALLRLRQVACDPRLVDPTQRLCGAKIEMLIEQLEEVMSEGHKALVFSQFTSMLDLVRKEFNKRKWDYEYLDGKSTNRGASVKRFQESPKCQLFLISLKAGGHGLNLTAADYVYILDPWWNPAVEAQAVDRAHRMGQERPVMAYRMIARDTVEEKIAHMQQSKKKLADAVISSDQSLIQSLSMEDLKVLFE